MLNLKVIAVAAALLLPATAAQASVYMKCSSSVAILPAEVVLFRTPTMQRMVYSLEIIDPTALQPLAHLELAPGQVDESGNVIRINSADRVGSLHLEVIFGRGTPSSTSVGASANFVVDSFDDNYGLMQFNTILKPDLALICTKE